jgi:hypothetical protein
MKLSQGGTTQWRVFAKTDEHSARTVRHNKFLTLTQRQFLLHVQPVSTPEILSTPFISVFRMILRKKNYDYFSETALTG